jgi:hypothetical protein
MHLPVRTTLALVTLTLLSGAALAAPVPAVTAEPSLLVTVADDSTSENEAIELEQNKVPSPEGSTASDPSPAMGAQPSGGDDNEATQLEQEKQDN